MLIRGANSPKMLNRTLTIVKLFTKLEKHINASKEQAVFLSPAYSTYVMETDTMSARAVKIKSPV